MLVIHMYARTANRPCLQTAVVMVTLCVTAENAAAAAAPGGLDDITVLRVDAGSDFFCMLAATLDPAAAAVPVPPAGDREGMDANGTAPLVVAAVALESSVNTCSSGSSDGDSEDGEADQARRTAGAGVWSDAPAQRSPVAAHLVAAKDLVAVSTATVDCIIMNAFIVPPTSVFAPQHQATFDASAKPQLDSLKRRTAEAMARVRGAEAAPSDQVQVQAQVPVQQHGLVSAPLPPLAPVALVVAPVLDAPKPVAAAPLPAAVVSPDGSVRSTFSNGDAPYDDDGW